MTGQTYQQRLTQEHKETRAILERLAQSLEPAVAQKYARLQIKLQRIDAALQRLVTGHYGYCQRCQRLIPAERLHLLPYAEHCFDCQRQLENECHQSSTNCHCERKIR